MSQGRGWWGGWAAGNASLTSQLSPLAFEGEGGRGEGGRDRGTRRGRDRGRREKQGATGGRGRGAPSCMPYCKEKRAVTPALPLVFG
jgi:hypothetical protein